MIFIVADCSATYSGRGDTTLPRGIRSIIIKNDGSIMIHNDEGIKPLNYMKNATHTITTINNEEQWCFDSHKESLIITIHKMLYKLKAPLIQEDPGLLRDGTEKQLQEELSQKPELFGENLTLLKREYPTGNGPIDLMFIDNKRNPIAVEVKRTATGASANQCKRYADALKQLGTQETEHGIIDFTHTTVKLAALNFRPKAIMLLEKYEIDTVTITKD